MKPPTRPASRRRPRRFRPAVLALSLAVAAACLVPASTTHADTLRPNRYSLRLQNRTAKAHDFTFLRNPAQVRHFVNKGWLVPVARSGPYHQLVDVSFPYARPEVRTFIQRLGQQYKNACGGLLVVTSLTRPTSHQPHNSSALSVHPTGMALDLRKPNNRSCRRWLESTLIYLENQGTLEASRERWPPHYHVALFPDPYRRYVARLKGGGSSSGTRSGSAGSYRVARGDTLWKIAQRHGTTTSAIKRRNGLRSNTIRPGQVLKMP